MQRLVERYAPQGQVGFRWHRRVDGKIVDPNAFTVLQMA
jgi:HK97 family phage major capsid protein